MKSNMPLTGSDYTRMYVNLEPHEMCAGQPDRDHDGILDAGNDACHGDSGGPLVCNIGGSAVLYGVISWGIRCAKQGAPGG